MGKVLQLLHNSCMLLVCTTLYYFVHYHGGAQSVLNRQKGKKVAPLFPLFPPFSLVRTDWLTNMRHLPSVLLTFFLAILMIDFVDQNVSKIYIIY